MKMIDNAARPTARAIAEIPRVRMKLEELPGNLAMEPRKEPEPNSVTNATVPGLELTKKMACSEAGPGREFELIGSVMASTSGDADHCKANG